MLARLFFRWLRSRQGRHGVVPTGVPWMAATDPAQRKPATFEHAMLLESLHGIFRAGRREAAHGWCQTRNLLIHTNEQNKKLPHDRNLRGSYNERSLKAYTLRLILDRSLLPAKRGSPSLARESRTQQREQRCARRPPHRRASRRERSVK